MESSEDVSPSMTEASPTRTRATRLAQRETRSEMSTQPRQPSRARSAPRDWLPNTRPQSVFAHKVVRRGNIQANRGRDWFLNLAASLEAKDVQQSKMCAKFYLFLRDFIPDGLTGRFAHISGGDVMQQLLCHSESTVSRHRVSKYANTALHELESWMGNYKTWNEALLKAQDANTNKNKAARRAGGKAPGLHSPAALLAVLVISHPDPNLRFRDWIGRLEIDWMVTQDRSTLEVQNGFWKGIHSENLDIAFATDTTEARKAEGDLLVDYDRLFGKDFPGCCKDIRPFLTPELAATLAPATGAMSDVDDLAETRTVVNGGGDAASSHAPAGDTIPKVTPEETARLRQRLNAGDAESDLGRLEEWLVGELQHPGEVLTEWCRLWESRIDTAGNYEDQMTIRSLFQQSLGRLRELRAASSPFAEALMLVDIAEDQAEAEAPEDARTAFSKLVRFQACQEANDQVLSRVKIEDPGQVDRVDKLRARQTAALCFITRSPYSDHWTAVLALEALYASCIAQGYQDPTMEATDLQFWQGKRGIALDNKTAAALKLTRWQLLALALPGSLARSLTPWQTQTFHRRFCTEKDEVTHMEFSKLDPIPVTDNMSYPAAIRDKHQNLSKLFGVVKQPDFGTAPVSPSLSAAPSSSLSIQSVVPDPVSISVPSSTPTPPHNSTPVPKAAPTNPSPTEERKGNRFAGKSFTKRVGSPLADPRSPKVARPSGGVVTRGDLSEELQDLKRELKGDMEELRLGLQATDMMEGCSAQLTSLSSSVATLRDDLKRAVDKNAEAMLGHKGQLSEVTTLVRELRAQNNAIVAMVCELSNITRVQKDDIITELSNIAGAKKDIITELNIAGAKDDIIAELKQKITAESQTSQALMQTATQQELDILKAIQDIQPPPPPPPAGPGQDGFLAQCTAPSGWDQKVYECTLLRGAWLYINCLGNPEHGVAEDEAALDVVNVTFPGLREDDIITALDHVHVQAYGSLFKK